LSCLVQKEMILNDIQSIENIQLADITEVKKKMEERRDEVAKHPQFLQEIKMEPDIFLLPKRS
ncbi:hypothetical protein Q8G71_37155, partial [Klebsiella pneumoniae]